MDQPKSLLEQKEEAVKLVNQLLKQIVALGDENQRLRNQLATNIDDIKSVQGMYTHAEIVRIMNLLFDKAHGIKKALCDHVNTLREEGADLPPISDNTWQVWRLSNHYPSWVVDELKNMSKKPLKPTNRHKWSQDEKDWIINQFLSSADGGNSALAKSATEHFKFKVNEAMIKSVLHHSSNSRYRNRLTNGTQESYTSSTTEP